MFKTILTFYTLSPQGSKVVIQIPTFSMISSNSPLNNEHLNKYLSQEVGLKQLLTTYKDETCLRQFLASIVLLGYHLFLTNHMGQVMKILIMTMIIEASHSNDQSNVSEDHSPLIFNINISSVSLRIAPLAG